MLLERKCHENKKHSRPECLELSGIPKRVVDGDLGGTVLNTVKKIISLSTLIMLKTIIALSLVKMSRKKS